MSVPPPTPPAANALDASIRQFWREFVGSQLAHGRTDLGRMLETALEFFFDRSMPAGSREKQQQATAELRGVRERLRRAQRQGDGPQVTALQARLSELNAQLETFARTLAQQRQEVADRLHVLSPALYAEGQALLADHHSAEEAQAISLGLDDALDLDTLDAPPSSPPAAAAPAASAPWLSRLSAASGRMGRALVGTRPPSEAEPESAADDAGQFREFEEIASGWLKPPRGKP